MKLQLIVNHTYSHIYDQFPWKWQLRLSGSEFVLFGTAETKNEAIRDAMRYLWGNIQPWPCENCTDAMCHGWKVVPKKKEEA